MSEQPKTQFWLLRARGGTPTGLPRDDDPWLDEFDRCYGMVVEAASEKRARLIANTIPLFLGLGEHSEDYKSGETDLTLRAIEDADYCSSECKDIDRFRHELTDEAWENKNVWLDPKYTTCVPLVCTGQERRVIWDVVRG